MEIARAAQTVGLEGLAGGGVAGAGAARRSEGEEGEVPVFCHVPVEGVEGVCEDGDEPGEVNVSW